MPLWIYLIILAVAIGIGAWRKQSEKQALQRRQNELIAQSRNKPNSTDQHGGT